MKNIKLYELEETYHNEKSSLEYPTVSYTKDTEKVWYMVKPIPHEIEKWLEYDEEGYALTNGTLQYPNVYNYLLPFLPNVELPEILSDFTYKGERVDLIHRDDEVIELAIYSKDLTISIFINNTYMRRYNTPK
jgi:hypothetical protein